MVAATMSISKRGKDLRGIELRVMGLRGIELRGMGLRGIELRVMGLRGIGLRGMQHLNFSDVTVSFFPHTFSIINISATFVFAFFFGLLEKRGNILPRSSYFCGAH